MYEFLDRLVTVALPRVRDFRGLNPKSFDGRGNFAMGIKEHIIFPEINYDEVDEVWGMDVIVCTTAQDRRRGAGAAQGASISRSGSDRTRRGRTMAKKSSIEKNNRRAGWSTQFAGKRAELKARRQRREPDAGGALPGAAQARRAAAQLLGRAHPQPLRDHRPAARRTTASSRCRASRCATSAADGLIPGLVKSSW